MELRFITELCYLKLSFQYVYKECSFMRPKSITMTEVTETEKLIAFANRHGLRKAAKKYGTSPASLSRWIRTQGFQMVREYRRIEAQS